MACETASFSALGTTAAVTVVDGQALPEALALVQDELRRIDETCSRFRDDSELAVLNRSAGRPFVASPLLLEALTVALYAAARTDGDVDPTVGRSLGALGWDRDFTVVVARREAPRLRIVPAAGWKRVRIDRARRTICIPARCRDRSRRDGEGARGRSLRARRAHGDGVGCARQPGRRHRPGRHGRRRAAGRSASPTTTAAMRRPPGQTIALAGGGLATSSTTVRRWRSGDVEVHHIVDPRSGIPASEVWRTVSVAAADCVQANSASTAAIVRGEGAVAWLERAGLPGAPRATRRHDRHHLRLARRGSGMNGVLTAGPVWYLMRGSGVVSLLLLTAVSALGMATVSRWRPGRVPRFVTLGLHRNLSLLAVVFLAHPRADAR